MQRSLTAVYLTRLMHQRCSIDEKLNIREEQSYTETIRDDTVFLLVRNPSPTLREDESFSGTFSGPHPFRLDDP